MPGPRLTAVVPNYNHAKFLPRCLESIVGQSRPPDEILVLDDCSTDDSMEVLESLSARYPIIKVRRNERNQGVLRNLNKLLAEATGEYFISIGADDRVLPGFFQEAMTLLERHPTAGICTGLTNVVDADGGPIGVAPALATVVKSEYLNASEAKRLILRSSDGVNANATVFRHDALLDSGGFLPELRFYADGFIALVLLLRHGGCFIPKPCMEWRKVTSGYSLSTAADRRLVDDTIRYAAKLMSGPYRDAFPAGYARRWAGSMFFELGRSLQRETRRREAALLESFADLQIRETWVLRACRSVLSLGLRVQALAQWGYLLLVLGHLPPGIIQRKLRRLLRRGGKEAARLSV